MDDATITLMGLTALLGLVFGTIFGLILGMSGTVNESELTQNGYSIVRHMESHGEFHTNWIEVIRK